VVTKSFSNLNYETSLLTSLAPFVVIISLRTSVTNFFCYLSFIVSADNILLPPSWWWCVPPTYYEF